MAPDLQKIRRPRPAPPAKAGGLELAQWGLAAAGWVLAVGWWSAPWLSSRQVDWQWLAWIPDWAWLILVGLCVVPGTVLARWTGGRRRLRIAVTLAALVGPAVGVASRDVGWRGVPPEAGLRVVFLNAQSPSESDAGQVVDAIERTDPDLVVVLNPGWMASVWRSRGEGRDPGESRADWTIQWRSPVLVASRDGECSLRTIVADEEIRVVRIGLPAPIMERLDRTHMAVVDLPSDPARDRNRIAERLQDALAARGFEGLDTHGLVLGDFNMTPRTPALVRLRGRLADLVSDAGWGWTATWPRERPLLRIDQVWGDVEGDVRVATFDPGVGGHRGFVIDLPASAGGADG